MDKRLFQRQQQAFRIRDSGEFLKEFRERVGADINAGHLKLPPLPELAVQLHKIATSGDPDIRSSIRLVERDANLAAQVLKVASSVAYGSTRVITDLRQAIMRMGIGALRDIAYVMTMVNAFSCGRLTKRTREVNTHSFVVARTTSFVCERLAIDSHYGFLCGLLHDIGRVTLLSALAQYGNREEALLESEIIELVTNSLHEEIGAAVLERWGVDSQVKLVAKSHHNPVAAGGAQALAFAVAVADQADRLGPALKAAEIAARLEHLPIGYHAGLSSADFLPLGEVIVRARNDPLLDLINH